MKRLENDKWQTKNDKIVIENTLYGKYGMATSAIQTMLMGIRLQAFGMRLNTKNDFIFMHDWNSTVNRHPKTPNAKYLRKEDYEQFEMKTSISLSDRVYQIAYHLLLFKKFVGIHFWMLAGKQNEITPTEFVPNCFCFFCLCLAWRLVVLALCSSMHLLQFTVAWLLIS